MDRISRAMIISLVPVIILEVRGFDQIPPVTLDSGTGRRERLVASNSKIKGVSSIGI